ncbi:MAG: YibE/F family protein [Patescibacteria group bacterium]
MNRKIAAFLILFTLLIIVPSHSFAQAPTEQKVEGVITKILEEKEVQIQDRKQRYQKLEVVVTSPSKKGEKLVIENGSIASSNIPKYQVGDKIVATIITGPGENNAVYISDYVRRTPLYILFFIFILLTVVIAKKRGIASLLGMAVSFFVIFQFILPQILIGNNPIMIAIFASAFLIPLSFSLSHGLNKKTLAAVIGTLISLVITGIIAYIFVEASKLTGFSSEEASFLEAAKQGTVNIKGLLLAGIIVSLTGILDDITISQAAIVYQLKEANSRFNFKDLYAKAMHVGEDHIASVVNTLVLVYTGAAMPLLLLFINTPHPFTEIINYEFLAEEIVRTLVASIGLILAVPITTFIACIVAKDN